ncbi:putative death-receptor fusion protein-domain-containing protein [Pyronema domesticum]|nr:putative death-receptor fusion protein-domain-containing protein [Pyronema domesticum]
MVRARTNPTLRSPFPAAFEAICDIFLTYFDDATSGLTKALKDLLTNTLSLSATLEASADVVRTLATRGLVGVSVGEGKKGGYYALDIAVRKGAGAAATFEYAGGAEKLVGEMLANLIDRNLGPAIGKAVVTLLVTRRKELIDEGKGEKEWLQIWQEPVKKALVDEELRPRIVNYVLPGLLKPSAEGFKIFVQSLGLSEEGTVTGAKDSGLGALLSCLKTGKELGFVGEIGDDTTGTRAVVYLNSELVIPLLGHALSHIRVAAFNLVVQSASITRPFSPGALSILKQALPPLHTESDAEVRDLIIGGIRNLIERIACSSYATEKELKNLQQKLRTGNRPTPDDIRKMIELDSRINDAKQFCEWYIELMETLLRPGSNYQRCITGLRALGFLIRSGVDACIADRTFAALPGHGSTASNGESFKKGLFKWPEFSKDINIFRSGIKRVLLEAMFDPFEDVRITSSEILRFDLKWDIDSLKAFLERGLTAMNESGRARDSDGFARTVALVFGLAKRGDVAFPENYKIWGFAIKDDKSGLGVIKWVLDILEKEYLKVAEADFLRAIKERPIHGIFESLVLILESKGTTEDEDTTAWREVHVQIFEHCQTIWRLTRAPLCLDSPEGHVPADFDEEDEEMGTQTVMSYSWRAIKESSALLGIILGKASFSSLDSADFEKGGKLVLEQLADIRHRGAFSSVSPSFVALCTRCFNSADANLQELPRTWLKKNLEVILEKSAKITRRSAGLPYLIVGVLASETDPKRPLLSSTIARLQEIATMPAISSASGEKMDLPQVHALNCLKFLFVDARMSQIVVPFMGAGLELAVSCFGSEIWAIRNCGVMLFTALTNRLFGLRKSRNDYSSGITTRSFFEKFVAVRTVLLKNLQEKVGSLEGGDAISVEMVYPALSLIARMEVDPEYQGMDDFLEPIELCMRSRMWKVREMSARAMAALVGPKQVVAAIKVLMAAGPEEQNVLHGNLCAVRALLERRVRQAELQEGEQVWTRIADIFNARFEDLVVKNKCSVTKAVVLQILSLHSEKFKTSPAFQTTIESYLIRNATQEVFSSSVVGRSFFKEHLVAFTLLFKPTLVDSLFSHTDEEILLYTADYILAHPELGITTPTTRLWELATTHPWTLIQTSSLALLHLSPPTSASESDFNKVFALLESPREPIKEAALSLLGPLICVLPEAAQAGAMEDLLLKLVKASDEEEPYTTRMAALSSLSSLAPLLQLKEGINEALIPAYTLIYDFLNDDDDEIRMLSASLAQKILGSDILLLPLAAAEKLALQLPRYFPGSHALLKTAINRITSGEKAEKVWEKATKKDTILFQREKQNLWVDIVGSIELWGVVAELVLARGVGAEEIQSLRGWVKDAKAVIAVKEQAEGDGEVPGGWGREEETVCFLARVQVAARVVGME